MDSLFEAFTQTETGRRAQEGTGLGLPISRKFVQLLGGDDIRVESPASTQVSNTAPPISPSKIQNPKPVLSEAEGSKIPLGGPGTTFAFEIRVEVVNPGQMDHEQSAREFSSEMDGRVVGLAPNQPRYRLLIVDDEPTNRQLLRELLAPLGFDLREAENGQQAIDIWQAFQPHLIWMDIRMPVLNGYEATKIIKSRQSKIQNPKLVLSEGSPEQGRRVEGSKIIALTASSFEEDKANILAAGCDDFLRKPFREAQLFRLISQHIGVQFIYETPDDSPLTGEPDDHTLTPELMASLPQEQLTRLAEAIELSDVVWANQIIDDIRPAQPDLARQLSRLVNNFEYGVILAVIERVTSTKE